MDEEDFETRLDQELPRGLPTAPGRDRGVFARWLEPDELTGNTWEPDCGLLLGKRDGRYIGWNDDRHVMTIAGSRAGMGQDVYVLDPFGVSGRPRTHFNPIHELHVDDDSLIEDASLFADALITHPDQGERHWTESAQALLRALILVAVADHDKTRRNLVTVRKLLMLTDTMIFHE